MDLAPCPSCRRHVAVSTDCPFCGAPATTAAPRMPSYAARLTRAAVFAGAAACSSTPHHQPPPPPPPPVEYPFDAPPAPAEGRASLSGVLRENGHRKAGVRIRLQREDDRQAAETITNDKGEFQFLDLEPGIYVVVPEPNYHGGNPRQGPVMQESQRVELAAGANERRDLTVVPPPPYVPDRGPCCKPYGAPPARRRIV